MGSSIPLPQGHGNHIRLTLFAAEMGPKRAIYEDWPDWHLATHTQDSRRALLEELRAEQVLESHCTRVYLSNEHLSSRLFTAKESRPPRRYNSPTSGRSKGCCVFASATRIISSAATLPPSRPAGSGRSNLRRGFYDRRYNYGGILSIWADVFGEENMIVRFTIEKSLLKAMS